MSKQSDFINAVAPLARAEYLNRSKWVLPSVCVAQAALESGWNTGAKTIFGIKGNGNSLATVEYINGKYVNTTACFKAYPNIASAVHGYYDLITGNGRYAGAVNNHDYRSAVQAIKNGGYATDPNYVGKIISIIEKYGLTEYDAQPVPKLSIDDVANKVIRGEYGNGTERASRLSAEGYDPNAVQARVNAIMGVRKPEPPRVNIDDIARKVIRGEFGNGSTRTARLQAAGYDPKAVQNRVNELLKG